MLEIIALLMLGNRFAAIARVKGRHALSFIALLWCCWGGGELLGWEVGQAIVTTENAQDHWVSVYAIVLGGGVTGGLIAWLVARAIPARKVRSRRNASQELPTSEPIVLRSAISGERSQRWLTHISPPGNQRGRYLLALALHTIFSVGSLILAGMYLVGMFMIGSTDGGLLWMLIFLALLALAGCQIQLAFCYVRRLRAPHALSTLKRDPRPPVLLLRAFRDDSLPLPGSMSSASPLSFFQSRERSLEEHLHDTLSACGPVVAIGRPGEKLPPLGASRFWVPGHVWKQAVDELLTESQYVAMVMGRLTATRITNSVLAEQHFAALQGVSSAEGTKPDDGLVWEAKQLFALPDQSKVLFVMPPIDEEEAARRWNDYRQLSQDRLPPYQGGEVAATFDSEGKCRVARVAPDQRSGHPRTEACYLESIQLDKRARRYSPRSRIAPGTWASALLIALIITLGGGAMSVNNVVEPVNTEIQLPDLNAARPGETEPDVIIFDIDSNGDLIVSGKRTPIRGEHELEEFLKEPLALRDVIIIYVDSNGDLIVPGKSAPIPGERSLTRNKLSASATIVLQNQPFAAVADSSYFLTVAETVAHELKEYLKEQLALRQAIAKRRGIKDPLPVRILIRPLKLETNQK